MVELLTAMRKKSSQFDVELRQSERLFLLLIRLTKNQCASKDELLPSFNTGTLSETLALAMNLLADTTNGSADVTVGDKGHFIAFLLRLLHFTIRKVTTWSETVNMVASQSSVAVFQLAVVSSTVIGRL